MNNYIVATILGIIAGIVAIPITKWIYKKLNWPWRGNDNKK